VRKDNVPHHALEGANSDQTVYTIMITQKQNDGNGQTKSIVLTGQHEAKVGSLGSLLGRHREHMPVCLMPTTVLPWWAYAACCPVIYIIPHFIR